MFQKTVELPISLTGTGVHSGKNVNITIKPADVNTGIVFKRIDLIGYNEISAVFENVKQTHFNTTLSNNNGASVSTVEHLMSAIYSAKITNLLIEIDGPEVPLMDGGSLMFVNALKIAGSKLQENKAKMVSVAKPFLISDPKKPDIYIKANPYDGLKIDFTIDFKCQEIGVQSYSYEEHKESFASEIAFAKTFGHINDIEQLRKIGLAQGGSRESSIIFDDNTVLNPEALTTPQDFVRHKILDFIGDIALSQHFIFGHFECYKSGHALNNNLLVELFKNGNYIEIN